MKRKYKILSAGTAFLVCAIAWWFAAKPFLDKGRPTDEHGAAETKASSSSIQSPVSRLNPLAPYLKSPIVFYGVVLDQSGTPLADAAVKAVVLDQLPNGRSIQTTTQSNGRFTIQTSGISLIVTVSKPGYSAVANGGSLKPSSLGFDYVAGISPTVHKPVASSPVVFNLRKPGKPIPLESLFAQPKLPRNGDEVVVGLIKGKGPTLKVRCRTMDDIQGPDNRYDWKCEVAVTGGSIQEVGDAEAFTAPETGYAETAIIEMPKTLDIRKWSRQVTKEYWLQFPDNTFGRIRFRMLAEGDHFAVIEGFRNPTANELNLEPERTHY